MDNTHNIYFTHLLENIYYFETRQNFAFVISLNGCLKNSKSLSTRSFQIPKFETCSSSKIGFVPSSTTYTTWPLPGTVYDLTIPSATHHDHPQHHHHPVQPHGGHVQDQASQPRHEPSAQLSHPTHTTLNSL